MRVILLGEKKRRLQDQVKVEDSISLLRKIGGIILFPHYYNLFVKKGKEYLIKE